MPSHFTAADLLRQKSIAPASYTHTQPSASATWTIPHNLDLPGVPTVIAYNDDGTWIPDGVVAAVNQNSATIAFPSAVTGTAIVYIPNAYSVDSILVKNELEIGGIEITVLGNKLRAGNVPFSMDGHEHSFDSLALRPTTLSGYGITDAVSTSRLGAPNGVATLNSLGQVPASMLPSYVDDVVEAATFAALPVTGESGKIYITTGDGKIWRWGGTTYAQIPTGGPVNTDNLPEGSSNLYFTNARAQAAVTNIAGNAGTAAKLQTQRTLALGGDLSGSVLFDGSANVTINAALAGTGITAGTYHGVTVDAKGRVTAGVNPTTLAGYGITDALSQADLTAHAAAADPHPQYMRSLTFKTTAAVSTSSTALTNVAAGVVNLAANSLYRITMYVRFSSNATGTGIRLGLICPTGSVISAIVSIPVRSDSTAGCFQGTIVSSGDYVVGTGVEVAGTAYIAVIQGVVSTGVTAGALQLTYGSEVSGSTVSVLPYSVGHIDIL